MVDLRETAEANEQLPRTIFVHMGSAARAEEFFSEYWPEALAIGDPKQRIYRAFGIKIGSVSQFLKPVVWKAYWANRSHGIGAPNGNTMRKPGAVLVRSGKVIYQQDFEHFGVQVDVDAILGVAS